MLNNRSAFTLVEIIAVISLISVTLFFAAPRLEGFLFTDESRAVSRWIVLNVADVKKKSVQTQQPFVLYIDLDSNSLWIDHAPGDALSDENVFSDTRQQTLELPPGFRINSVLFPPDRRISSGAAAVAFYPDGYSDRAVIHLTDRKNHRKSFIIEAFLPHVRIHDDHVRF